MGFFLRALYYLKDAASGIWYSLAFLALIWFLATPHDFSFADWIIAGCGFGLGASLFVRGFLKLRESRLIENTPLEAIRGIPMGRVHVRGKTTGGEPLASLFTHTPCFYYWAMIERYQQKGKSKSWVTIRNEAKSRWFYLDDGTGRVLVNPHGAEYDLVKTLSVEFELLRVRRSYVEASLGIPAPTEELFKYVDGDDSPLRFTESCLIAGREHNILGTCSQNPNPADEHDRNLVSKGGNDSTFIITSKKEQELEKAWRGKALLKVAGGAAFMIATTATALGGLGYFKKPPPPPPELVETISATSEGWIGAPDEANRTGPLTPTSGPLPKYPPLAKKKAVSGTVTLEAVIAKDGTLKDVKESPDINGNLPADREPLLVPSAMEAVSRWRYQPLLKNGKPVEAQIMIFVHFDLDLPK